MKNYIKLTFATLTIFALGFLFAGCQTFDGESQMITKEGVKVEKLLAQDSFMVMKLGADSQSQNDAIKVLSKKFPQDPYVLLMDSIRDEIDSGSSGASYVDDVLPVIGEMPKVMFGFTMIDPSDDPEVLVIVEVADKTKAVDLMEKLIADENGSKEQYKNYTIYTPKENDTYVALYKDVFVIAPEKDFVIAAVDRGDSNGQETLLNNAGYQKGIGELDENLAFFYINPAYVVSNGMTAMENETEMSDSTKAELESLEKMKEYIEVIEGEMFAFSAEQDGIRMKMNVYGDEEKMKELGFPMGDDVLPAYLYKQLPGDDLMLYVESSNLKISLEMIEKMYSGVEELDTAFKQMKAAIQLAGIDYDNELLPMLDKGYAISLYENGSMIPEFGLFFDVSSNLVSAQKIIGLVDKGVQMMVTQNLGEFEDVYNMSSEGDTKKIAIDLSKLPEELKSDVPESLMDSVFEFHYGVKDDVMYLALYNNLTDGGFEVVANNPDVKKALSYIPGYDKSLTFIDFGKVMNYIDDIFQDMGEEPEEYVIVKEYMKPVKSMIMSAADFENGMAIAEGFILIE